MVQIKGDERFLRLTISQPQFCVKSLLMPIIITELTVNMLEDENIK